MDTAYLNIPEKFEKASSLQSEMFVVMGDVVGYLSKRLFKEYSSSYFYESPIPGAGTQITYSEKIRRRVKDDLIPFLLEYCESVPELLPDVPSTREWFQVDSRATQEVFAWILDLGLLSPAFPEVLLALAELVNSDIEFIKTAALLSLLSCGFQHPQLGEINLYDAIEWQLLFGIPLQMLQKILPGLEGVLRNDKRSLNLLEECVGKRVGNVIGGPYRRAEFAILLANLNVFNPLALETCLLEWPERFEPDNPHYHVCRVRCLAAAAKLISNNRDALDHYIRTIKELEDPDVDDWTNTLLYLEPENFSPELFPKLLSVADALWSAHLIRHYIKAVEAFVEFANTGRFMVETRDWILTRLKGDNADLVRFTIEGITNLLPPVSEEFKQQILTLLQDDSSTRAHFWIKSAAIKLVVKWALVEAKPLLRALARDAECSDYDRRVLATAASEALRDLDNS